MMAKKIFQRKTRKGAIVKVVREHYLRDDIGCGLSGCPECEGKGGGAGQSLSANDKWTSPVPRLCDTPHILILDTEVTLGQVDVLQDDVFCRVILPQTVWEEAKRRNPSIYRKLKDIVFGNPEKNFIVFQNEFHRDTYTPRLPKETSAARNSRAIRHLALWYHDHSKKNRKDQELLTILLTSTEAQKKEAQTMQIPCFTFAEYVRAIDGKPELSDLLVSEEGVTEEGGRATRKPLFPLHKSLAGIQAGLKTGRFRQGNFQVSRENYLEAYVYVDGESAPIFIKGLVNCNRAIHDDIVAIELLPEAEWSCPARLLKVRDVIGENEEAEEEEAAAEEEEKVEKLAADPSGEKQPSGCVVGIIRSNRRPYCGVLLKSPVPGARRHLFSPAEKRVPRIRMETRRAEELEGKRLIVCVDNWPRDSRYPNGHLSRVLGPVGDRQTDNEVLLLEHDITHGTFSREVLSCLPSLPWTIGASDEAVREDLRHLDICSVDPPGCTDIDDALHCRRLDDGLLEVGVHIADVSHFVPPGCAMDAEAESRGTTVYLIDRRIDMLPELLSSNICSLRGGEDRFAFSVLWTMSSDAEVVSCRFVKSIIRSRAALTYAEAQAKIDDKSQKDAVSCSLRQLRNLARKMRRNRQSRGALSLASLEIRFNIDSESHDPISVQEKSVLETNWMVEEMMLLANITVANRIYEQFPDCAVLRRHPVPAPANYKPLIQAAEARGFTIQVDSGKALAESLEQARIPGNTFFNTMLRILATRCMTQALYFVSGTLDSANFIHFGLASPIYTHFTSPIRRYADLLVHRLLAVAINAHEPFANMLDQRRLQAVCNNLNYRHKNAQYAGRASVLLNTHLYFRDKTEDLEGYILMIRENALQILIPKYGLESPIFLGRQSPFSFNKSEDAVSASTSDGPVTLRAFDRVKVQLSLDQKDVQHPKLRLALVEPRVPDFSVEPIFDTPQPPTEPPITANG